MHLLRRPVSGPTHGVAACNNIRDQPRNSHMHVMIGVSDNACMSMRLGCVFQNAHDFTFRQNMSVIERQKQGFANRKGRFSRVCVRV